MLTKYFVKVSVVLIMLPLAVSSASPWKAGSTEVEVRRDDYHGQHLYVTFEEGAVTMLRASLPNNWKITEASGIDDGIVISVEGRPKMCYSSKSFGRVYSETLSLEKDKDSEKADVWERHQVSCR